MGERFLIYHQVTCTVIVHHCDGIGMCEGGWCRGLLIAVGRSTEWQVKICVATFFKITS
jgi:hypothetical protein